MVSVRGLQKGFGTPLEHFKGRLDAFNTRLVTGGLYGESTRVDLMFRDVEVLKSKEPYNFPVAEISIKHSEQESSVWGIFALSCIKFLADDQDISDLKGQMMELQLTPGHEFGKDKESGELIVRDCWECVGVEGMEAGVPAGPKVSSQRRALELLDGKIEQEFHQDVFSDPVVKGDGELVSAILGKTFLTAMEAQGIIAKGEGDTWKVDWSKAPA